jgi:Trk K+ transport system NAD-binding subunit
VTVIVPRDSDLEELADADIIEGDASSVELLRKVGVEKAQAVLALAVRLRILTNSWAACSVSWKKIKHSCM